MNIGKRVKRQLILGIIAPVCLVVGIPIIVFSAIGGAWIAMSLGIVMVLFGFYGTPLLWVFYGKLRAQHALWLLITESHILTVSELASTMGKSTKYIQDNIHLLISKRCLVGYSFVGRQQLVAVQPTANSAKHIITHNKCDNCGALLEDNGDKYTCPYCGSWYKL